MVAVATLGISSSAYAVFPDDLVCGNVLPALACDEEDFSSYPATSSAHVNLGMSFTSPSGFYFEALDAPQFQVHSLTNIGKALYVPGSASYFILPTARDSVAFQISGNGDFEFAVYDASLNYLVPYQVELNNESKTMLIAPGGAAQVGAIVIHHIDDVNSCDPHYWEPFIAGIIACDI